MQRTVPLIAVLLITAPAVTGAAYVKYDGVDGEATRAGDSHSKTIDVLSWSWGMQIDEDGRITQEPVVVHVNSSHGEFWFTDLVPGEYSVSRMTLGAAGSDSRFELEDLRVRSYQVTATGSDVREEVSFYYSKISMHAPSANGTDTRIITYAGLE